MKRDTTYFIVGTNSLRFDKIKWYKNEYDGMFIVLGNSGDFWFEVRVEYPEKYFDVHRWIKDACYQYRAFTMRIPKGVYLESLKPYITYL